MKQALMAFNTPFDEEVKTTIKDWIPRDPGILILVGALFLVTVSIFIWAIFFRKRTRRPRYKFHDHSRERHTERIVERLKAGRLFFRKRRRRRHRARRRNPTLAEAGGLPPIRTDEDPPTST